MTEQELLDLIEAAFVDRIDAKPEELTPRMKLVGDQASKAAGTSLGADSLDLVEVSMEIEKLLEGKGIKTSFNEEEFKAVVTYGDVVRAGFNALKMEVPQEYQPDATTVEAASAEGEEEKTEDASAA
ncbi:MAG TPA: hypothetical protein VG935_03655 [Patescibacteria group bacterium]|nr:hypothetical protein [Patescibacteria group bacterium]